MAMKKKPGRSKVEVGIPSTEAVFSAGNNNASGSLIANLATQNRAELAYELREIALQDIELNPDNAIFRQLDTDEDVETLANDIDRNGLMHNLVVYPRTDGKQTKYVLLSGERRYKALNYLQARGDAKWNTVKNCRVVTTPLSDNEKKVMLLSANLQVRGGFANEMIRRKAVAELVSCLQAEPYNLTAAEAKKAIKEATPINGRQIDKDLSIEKNLNEGLKDLLDRGFVLRSEAESFLRMTPEEQRIAAQMLQQLYAIAYNGQRSHSGREKSDSRAIRGCTADGGRHQQYAGCPRGVGRCGVHGPEGDGVSEGDHPKGQDHPAGAARRAGRADRGHPGGQGKDRRRQGTEQNYGQAVQPDKPLRNDAAQEKPREAPCRKIYPRGAPAGHEGAGRDDRHGHAAAGNNCKGGAQRR